MKKIHDSYLDDAKAVVRTFDRLYRYMSVSFREAFIDEMLSRVYLTDDGDLIVESQVSGGAYYPGMKIDWHYSVMTVRLIDAMDYEDSASLNELVKALG